MNKQEYKYKGNILKQALDFFSSGYPGVGPMKVIRMNGRLRIDMTNKRRVWITPMALRILLPLFKKADEKGVARWLLSCQAIMDAGNANCVMFTQKEGSLWMAIVGEDTFQKVKTVAGVSNVRR